MDERNFKTRKFLKNTEFCNVEFENGRGFIKTPGFDEKERTLKWNF